MKRLILCCDGTWNKADQESNGVPCPTNVVKLGYRVAKRGGDIPQIVYYDQGVGSGNVLDRLTGGAFRQGLEENIHDAYRFLVANYEPGDELYLFGFSRGAYTARSIGGMVRKCGVLRREFVQHYRDAIALYRSEHRPTDAAAVKFRKDYSVSGGEDIKIKFIGVWDTVGALGIPLRGLRWLTRGKHQFHATELSLVVENAFHALAIDERRAPFAPTLWLHKPKPNQMVEQVWFCGVHSDIGGGYPECGLSDITLGWMMEKARGIGLALDDAAVQAHPLHPNSQSVLHNSKTGLYRLTAGVDRSIGRDDQTQSVHDSVRTRWDNDPTYRPPALRAYFKRTGDRRGNEE